MPDAGVAWDNARARTLLRSMFDAAVASADPFVVLAKHLPPKPKGRCIVVGAGKASAAMAAALEAAWPDVPLEGVVVTRDGHAAPTVMCVFWKPPTLSPMPGARQPPAPLCMP